MEIELKYAVRDEQTLDALWQDPWLTEIMEEGTRSAEAFDAIYYDTEDGRLLAHNIAYRIRQEGKKRVACLKWSGKTDGALHEREELNVTLPEVADRDGEGEENALRMQDVTPDPTVFSESSIGEELLAILDEAPLRPLMEVRVVRRAFKIDTGTSIMEVSLDQGAILVEKDGVKPPLEDPICELEVELYSGEQEDLLEVGKRLADKYDITPEERSKFHRGLALRGLIHG